VPEHLKERVKNQRAFLQRAVQFDRKLREAAWAKIGAVRDPNKPMDKTIRKVERSEK